MKKRALKHKARARVRVLKTVKTINMSYFLKSFLFFQLTVKLCFLKSVYPAHVLSHYISRSKPSLLSLHH